MTDEVVNSIVSRVSQEMASRAWICGSPKEVAEVTKDYIDAGMTICAPYDMLATLSSPEDFDATIKRQLEFCQLIKDF
jgi:phthiodiolone/phenolphthiodiolone dimycocerosates ketoreductase